MSRRQAYCVNWSASSMNGNHEGRFGSRRKFVHEGMSMTEGVVRSNSGHDSPEFVYDMEMEGHPSFVANGVLVHNTATPVRGSSGLRGYFDDLVIGARPSELIEKGWIVAPDVYTVPEEMMPDVSKVKTTKDGDFDPRGLAEACERWDLVGSIVDTWMKHGRDAQTIYFAASIKESMMIAQSFRSANVPIVHIDGSMSDAERERIFAQLRNREVRGVTNVDLTTEGFDAPIVKTVGMARPTQSLTIHIQTAGRCMRKYGEERATILDHVGNVQRHGFPDADIDWSLGEMPRRRVSIKRCPQCWHANASNATVCADPRGECGPPPYVWTREENEKIERELIAAEGRLARAVRDKPTSDPEKDSWIELCREAIAREYSEEWARLQFQQRHGSNPSAATFLFPTRPQASWPDARRRKKWDQLRAGAYKATQGGSKGDPMTWARDKYRVLFGEDAAALEAREQAALSGQTVATTKDEEQGEMEF